LTQTHTKGGKNNRTHTHRGINRRVNRCIMKTDVSSSIRFFLKS
jgi:hypothetical protein